MASEIYIKKWSSEVFCEKGALRNIQRKTPVLESQTLPWTFLHTAPSQMFD